MKDVIITVKKTARYPDLIEEYEKSETSHCDMTEGKVFISKCANKPSGFCESAWQNLFPYVFALSSGASDFYDGWMKDKNKAMISCNDGFRPVSFLLETKND